MIPNTINGIIFLFFIRSKIDPIRPPAKNPEIIPAQPEDVRAEGTYPRVEYAAVMNLHSQQHLFQPVNV